MCGRFTLRAPASVVAEQFSLFRLPPFAPRYNIAPTQPVPVVRLTPQQTKPSARELVWLRWGLIPGWAKDPAIGNRMINARSETVAEKPAYRAAFRRRRCLVVADGFYEWQAAGRGPRKQPYFIRLRDERPFAFAGLWECWHDPDGAPLESCTLLTTEANRLVQPIHDRMPVILAPDDYSRWLDPQIHEPEPLRGLLRPFGGAAMTAHAVGTLVNNPRNDDPQCVEPL